MVLEPKIKVDLEPKINSFDILNWEIKEKNRKTNYG